MVRRVEATRFYLGSPRTPYKLMKQVFVQEGRVWVDAAKKAFEDQKWYVREHENYVKLGASYSEEAERCWEEIQRLDEEFLKCVIEASICLTGAKVCLRGMEYTKRMFPEIKRRTHNGGRRRGVPRSIDGGTI